MSIKSLFGTISGIQFKEILSSKNRIKTDIIKSKNNIIDVRYISKDYRTFIPTTGEIFRDTDVSIIKISNPDDLAVIITDNSILLNKLSKTEIVDVVEGEPYTNDFSNTLNEKIAQFQEEHKGIKRFLLPLNINNVPNGNYSFFLDNNNKNQDEKIAITQKFLFQSSTVKIFEAMFKPKSDGIMIGFIMGVLVGIIAGIFFTIYALG